MIKRLKLSFAFLLFVAIYFFAADAHAQFSYAAPQFNGLPNVGQFNTSMPGVASNCPCGCGSSSGCVDNPGNCDLWVSPGYNSGTVCTKPYPVTPPTNCDVAIQKIPFYKDEQQRCPGVIKVPKKVELTKEKYRFERKTYNVCGCTIKVCVPCAIDTVCSSQCRPADESVELIAKIRTETGKADIWVVGVRGLPSEAVLALNVTAQQANSKFPGATFSY